MEATKRSLAPLPLLALLLLPVSGAHARPQEDAGGGGGAGDANVDDGGAEVESDDLPSWTQEELNRARTAEDAQDAARKIGTWDDAERAVNEGSPTWNNGDAPPAPAAPRSAAPQPAEPQDMEPQDVPEGQADRGDVQFDDFYGSLSAQGAWVQTPEYGYVFVPNRQREVQNWRPYLYGRWIWTSYGWTWASDESFGWATYHYGRWSFSSHLGWYWVPGYTWGPAWVAWRYGDAAVGWAPLYPGYVAWGESYPYHGSHWVFVGSGFFYDVPVWQHCYAPNRSYYYYHHTGWSHPWRYTHGHNVYVGPRHTYVRHYQDRSVHTARIVRVREPGATHIVQHGDRPVMQIYRPQGTRRAPAIAGSGLNRSVGERHGDVRPHHFSEAQRIAPHPDARSQRITPGGHDRIQPMPRVQPGMRVDPSPRMQRTPRIEPAPRVQPGPGMQPAPRRKDTAPRKVAPPSGRPSGVTPRPQQHGSNGSFGRDFAQAPRLSRSNDPRTFSNVRPPPGGTPRSFSSAPQRMAPRSFSGPVPQSAPRVHASPAPRSSGAHPGGPSVRSAPRSSVVRAAPHGGGSHGGGGHHR